MLDLGYRQLELLSCIYLVPKKGYCWKCSKKLTGKQRKWCSVACSSWFKKNHVWRFARKAARRRDGWKCVQCGESNKKKLEVDHIEPRNGAGYNLSCGHHLENLQVLCHSCHLIKTNRQRQESS